MNRYLEYIDEMEKKYNLKPGVLRQLVKVESGGRITATSDAGAYGLTQLMPETAKELGVDREDPFQNIEGGARYLRQNLDRFDGSYAQAFAAYNAGPNHSAVKKRDWGMLPKETRNYLQKFSDFIIPTAAAEPAPEVMDDSAFTEEEPKPMEVMDDSEFTVEEPTEPPTPEKMSAKEAALIGTGQGLTFGFGDELKAGLGAGLDYFTGNADNFTDNYKQLRDAYRAEEEKARADQPLVTYGTEIASGLLLPGGAIKNAKSAKEAMQAAGMVGGLTGGAAGAGYSDADTATGLLQDTATGVGLGATLGAGVGNFTHAGPKAVKEMPQLFDEFGIDRTLEDDLGNIAKNVGDSTRYLPGSRVEASRSAKLDQYTKAAEGMLPNPPNEDLGGTMKKSMVSKMNANKKQAGRLYDEVERQIATVEANGQALPPLALDNFNNSLNEMVTNFGNPILRLADDKLAGDVAKLQAAREAGGGVTYADARGLQRSLNNMLSRAYKSPGAVGDAETHGLSAMKRALEDDLTDWATRTGNENIVEAQKAADLYYRGNVAPFKNRAPLRSMVNVDDAMTESLPKKILNPQRPKMADLAMENMGANGVAALREQVNRNMLEGAHKLTEDGKSIVNPNTVVMNWNKNSEVARKVLPKDEFDRWERFVKMSRNLSRLPSMGNPPTGNRLITGGVVMMTGGLHLGVPLTTWGVDFLLGSRRGYNLMNKLSMAKSSDAAMRLINQANKQGIMRVNKKDE